MSNNKNTPQSKSLSGTKLFYMIFALVLIAGLILFSSGVFDSPVISELKQQGEEQSQASNDSSPNLANLNEISKLEDLVKQNPNDFESLLNLAHLLNDSGFYDKAILNYKKYLEKNPQSPDVWVDMGVCYFNLKNNDEAIKTMNEAIKINPRHQIGLFNLGIVNFSSGNIEEAKKFWQKSVDVNPTADIAQKAKELINAH